jgi:hypothetical protein
MRMIISMRAISCNNWISNNDKELSLKIYTSELSKCCGSIFRFYYRLAYKLRFYQRALFNIDWYINILGEDNYLYENN